MVEGKRFPRKQKCPKQSLWAFLLSYSLTFRQINRSSLTVHPEPIYSSFKCRSKASESLINTSRAFEPSKTPTIPAASNWSIKRPARL